MVQPPEQLIDVSSTDMTRWKKKRRDGSFRYLVFFLVCNLLPVLLHAQYLPFRNFQAKDGLPSSEVYFVMQDHRGLLWFGTDAGISCYDGYRFRNYTSNDGLCDNTVFQLYEDRHHRIWCRTISGCVSYFENNRFVSIGAGEIIRKEKSQLLLTSLHVDDQDTLWLGSQNGKIIRVAPPYDAQSVHIITSNTTELLLFEKGVVYSNSALLGGKSERMPVKIRAGDGRLLFTDTLTPAFIIRYIRENSSQMLLAIGNVIYRYEKNRLSVLFTCEANVIALYADSFGRLWVGLMDHGLIILEPSGEKCRRTHHYLDNDRISYITSDYEGGIWISSLKNGVFYLPRQGIERFTAFPEFDNRMISILAAGNTIYSSNYNGSVLAIRDDSLHYRSELLVLPGTDLNKKLFLKGTDSILIANVGLELLHLKTKRISRLMDTLQPGTLTDMTPATGNTWWVSNPVRVGRIDITTGRTDISFSVPGTRVNCLHFREDTLWVGCIDGLWMWTRGTLQFLGLRFPELKNRIDAIEEVSPAELVLATRGAGVILFNRKRCQMISKQEGLRSSICRSLLPAGKDGIWVGTNNGLNLLRLRPRPHVVCVIGSGDGLDASDIAQLCFSGQKLYAATTSGIFIIDTAAYFHFQHIAPRIYMNAVHLKELQIPLSRNYDVSHDQHTVQFDFLGLSFNSRGKMLYRYRLEGLDTAWTVTPESFARYGSLAPGDYRFVVYAINGTGIQSSNPEVIRLHIRKPFWSTWWFISTSVILLIVWIWIIIRVRVKRVRKLAEQEASFRQRISETELKALRAQMNPHFVFNAIGSIQNFILNNRNEDANRYLLMFAQLIRNVLEQSKEEWISLEQETATLRLYLGIESLRFKHGFSWNIQVENCPEPDHVLITPLLLQPFVENALWHGLKTKETGADLNITIRKEGETLLCIIEDNGIGREAAALQQGNNIHRSMGTTISKDRLKTIEELIGRKTKLEINDLYTPEGKACGTRIRITLPLLTITK